LSTTRARIRTGTSTIIWYRYLACTMPTKPKRIAYAAMALKPTMNTSRITAAICTCR
jgi:hypothetical protein